jgi:sigma-B regulation protein RsbU (phosphoserine phosphatase)
MFSCESEQAIYLPERKKPCLAAGRIYGMHVLHKVGEEMVARTRENLIMQMDSRLRLLVQSYSALLWKERDWIEMALSLQARMVDRALQGPILDQGGVCYAEDFNAGVNLPGDAMPMALGAEDRPGAGSRGLRISQACQVFKIPDGSPRLHFAAEVDRLATLTPVYQDLHARLKDHVLWHFTALKDGLYGAYPGHEGLVAHYDPRDQPWYRAANDAKAPWSDPYVDPATGRIVVAGLRSVHWLDGGPAGLTGIVVPISSMLDQPLLTDHIPPETRPYMCYLATRKDSGQPGARIIAGEADPGEDLRRQDAPIGEEWLNSTDPAQFQAMLEDAAAGQSGARRMPHEGRDAVWVYGPTHPGAFLVLITPYDEIIRASRKAGDEVAGLMDRLVRATLAGMSGIALLIIVLAIGFSRTVTRPIQALVEGAQRLARGDFSARVSIRSRDEFGEMGRAFNNVGPQLLERYEMRQSLSLAMEVQQNLMPQSDPAAAGLDIAGKSLYCDETGGDYYDYLQGESSQPEALRVVVGDVAGHGLSSALLMTTGRAFIRQRAALPGSLDQIVADVNRQLVRDVDASGQFMTLFLAQIDRGRGSFTWVRAGHDPAILFDLSSQQFTELRGQGLPLGIFAESSYGQMSCAIRTGQVILIGTDGIWEAENPAGELFGKQRLHRIVRQNAQFSARRIVDAVLEGVAEFRNSHKAQDDITLVVIKVV